MARLRQAGQDFDQGYEGEGGDFQQQVSYDLPSNPPLPEAGGANDSSLPPTDLPADNPSSLRFNPPPIPDWSSNYNTGADYSGADNGDYQQGSTEFNPNDPMDATSATNTVGGWTAGAEEGPYAPAPIDRPAPGDVISPEVQVDTLEVPEVETEVETEEEIIENGNGETEVIPDSIPDDPVGTKTEVATETARDPKAGYRRRLPPEIDMNWGDLPETPEHLFDPRRQPRQIGGDVLGQAGEQALLDTYERGGLGAFGEDQRKNLQDVIDERGGMDEERMGERLESQTELMNRQRQSQTNQAMAELANRGMLSTSGIQQGKTGTAITNIERELAETYAPETREIGSRESEMERQSSDQRVTSALQNATSLSGKEVDSMLGMAKGVTERQKVISDIVGDELDRNMAWSQFTAEHDLKRNVLRDSMRKGKVKLLMDQYKLWQGQQETAGRGFLGKKA